MTEAVDHRIGIVITGATVPAREPRIRTELDHSERHSRAGKRVPMPARANERIDIASEVALCRGVGREYQQHADKDSSFFERIYKIFQGERTTNPAHLEPSCESCTHGAVAIA